MAVYACGLDPCFWTVFFLSSADYEGWAQQCYNQQWLEKWTIAPVHHNVIALLMYVFQLKTFTQNRKYLSTGEPLQPFRSPGAQTTAGSSIFVAHFSLLLSLFLKTQLFTFTFTFSLFLSFSLSVHSKNFLSGAEIRSDATAQCCLPHVTVWALFMNTIASHVVVNLCLWSTSGHGSGLIIPVIQ